MKEQMHEYLSRNLNDKSFEFNWKKNGMILQFVLILSINTISFLVNKCTWPDKLT
jgi:hypothetical protein